MSPPEPRQIPQIARAALAVLPAVRLEVDAIAADRDAAQRDLKAAGRSADAQRDATERFVRLTGRAQGAEDILRVITRLAQGQTAGR